LAGHGPGGRSWIETTIRGHLDRGTGLLNNTVYIGQLSWDRCSYAKNPQTGRRVARVNPAAQREVTAVPELRIVDQALWDRVKARQDVVRTNDAGSTGRRRPDHAPAEISAEGLITCGVCGGGYTIIGADRYGCATLRRKGPRDNCHTITRQAIEARMLGYLKQRMLAPELVEEFVRAFAEECARAGRDRAHDEGKLHKERLAVERSFTGILKAIEAGAWNETLRSRLTELELRKAEIDGELARAMAPTPVALHPNAAGLYAERVADLEMALNDPELLLEAAASLRSLIQQVVLRPDSGMPQNLAIDLHGDLALILSLAAGGSGTGRRRGHAGSDGALREKLSRPGVLMRQLTVVAGTGFEPVTFRL
jgi:site-specific DNA recombinase